MPDPSTHDLTDGLILRIANGDRQALAELHRLHAARLLGVLIRVIGDRTDAEDVLQAVFLAVWKRADQFDPRRGRGLSWLVCISRNRGLDLVRTRNRRRKLMAQNKEESFVERAATQPMSGPDMLIDRHLLRHALNVLSENQRVWILLAFQDGYTHAEIAEQTHTPLGTVKAGIRRGLRKLREELDGKDWLSA